MDKAGLVMCILMGLALSVGMNVAIILDFVREHGSDEYVIGVLMLLFASIALTSVGAAIITFAITTYRHRDKIKLWKKFQIPK